MGEMTYLKVVDIEHKLDLLNNKLDILLGLLIPDKIESTENKNEETVNINQKDTYSQGKEY